MTREWPDGLFYGDGSGGRFSSYPTLRRCGVFVARVVETVLQYGVYFPLRGERQTAPRAEITAAIALAMHLTEGASVLYITDNQPLYNAFRKGEAYSTQKTINKDLYLELFALIRTKKLDLLIDWMPSHLKEHSNKQTKTQLGDFRSY